MRCLVVDDEYYSRMALKEELALLGKHIEVCGEADSVASAIQQAKLLLPDVILLDIQLGDGNGFDVIEEIADKNIRVIFITAYSEFAIRAFKVSAIDYLLKPVSAQVLKNAFDKAIRLSSDRIQVLAEQMVNPDYSKARIALPISEGYSIHQVEDIIRFESFSNYSYAYFSNGEKLLLSKTLKDIESLLNLRGFERVHKSHLVNMTHVKKYLNKDGGILLLSDGDSVPVSQRKKTELLSNIQKISL